jgi:hypothetical protein
MSNAVRVASGWLFGVLCTTAAGMTLYAAGAV